MNLLLKSIIEIEENFNKMNPNSICTITIDAKSLGELQALCSENEFKGKSVTLPYIDSPLQDYYYIKYRLVKRPKICIVIKF